MRIVLIQLQSPAFFGSVAGDTSTSTGSGQASARTNAACLAVSVFASASLANAVVRSFSAFTSPRWRGFFVASSGAGALHARKVRFVPGCAPTS